MIGLGLRVTAVAARGGGALGSPAADTLKLVADLNALLGGDVVLGAYDYRANVTASGGVVDAWADVRASGGGPVLTQTLSRRPALTAAGLTFDGFDDFLRNASTGRLAELTDFASVVLVGRLPVLPSAGNFRNMVFVSGGGTTRFLDVYENSAALNVIAANTVPAASAAPSTTGTRVLHATRGGRSGSTLFVSNQQGSTAAVVAGPVTTAAVAAGTINRVTIGANLNDSPSSAFANLAELKALFILSSYTDAGAALVNAWAQSVHGATLT